MSDPEKESLWGFRYLGSSSGGAMSPEEQERVRRNFSVVALVVLCLFALLFLRLWFLQLVQGEDLQQRSEQNRLRQQDLPPWRGKILDHNGGVLVANRPSYDLVAVMEDVGDIPVLARRLASLLKLDQKQVTSQLENAKAAGQYQVRLRGALRPGFPVDQPRRLGVEEEDHAVFISPRRRAGN